MHVKYFSLFPFAGLAVACLLEPPPLSAYTNLGNNVLQSDGSASDTQAAINASSNGYTVQIPSGAYVWTSGITISKAITLQGAGSGRVVAYSATQLTCGTGTQVLALNAANIAAITIGGTLTIERLGTQVVAGIATGTRTSMTGTVTSYSGTTLTMNITSAVNSGVKQSVWIVSTPATTSLTNSAGSGEFFTLTESTSGSLNISGIRFLTGTGTGDFVQMNTTTGGQPILFHDCYIEDLSSIAGSCFLITGNRGVIWNVSAVAYPFSMAPTVIHHKAIGMATSWTTASTMGTADTTGTANLYVENCDFDAWLNAGDMDDNARVVVRYCTFNNAGYGSHGADTSNYGGRHMELYNNTFVFNGFSNGETFNLNWWIYLRGGTGAVHDNVMPHITSQDYGSKADVNMTVMNLSRAAGPNPLWGQGTSSGADYHCPRQVGSGYVTGTGKDGLGRTNDSVTYVGDSEPIYFWNNTGSLVFGMSDYTTGSAYDTSSDYIVANRDYYANTVKPGYTAYSYPHPLRAGAGAGGGGGSAPAAPVITSPTTATAKVGTAFTYTIVASNSPTSYSATSLPAGLSVNTSTGLISGTPTAIGTNSVTIGATNAGGSGTATLVIAPTAATTAIQTN